MSTKFPTIDKEMLADYVHVAREEVYKPIIKEWGAEAWNRLGEHLQLQILQAELFGWIWDCMRSSHMGGIDFEFVDVFHMRQALQQVSGVRV